MSDSSPRGLLVCDDFFFTSKVTGTAQGVGLALSEAGSQAEAVQQISDAALCVVIVDLNLAGLDVVGLLAELPAENRPEVIAFDSHVNVERIQAAKDAGCDEVLPRSRFSAELPALLGRYV